MLASRKTTKEQDDVYSLSDATAVYQLLFKETIITQILHTHTMGTLHFFFASLDSQITHNRSTKHNSALEKLPHYVSGRLKLTLAFFDTPEFAPVGFIISQSNASQT